MGRVVSMAMFKETHPYFQRARPVNECFEIETASLSPKERSVRK